MKILFIYPNAGSQLGFNYGLAHMSAVLKQAGHEVKLLHLAEELAPLPDEAQLRNLVSAYDPGIIGFSVVTNQWHLAEQTAAWIRKQISVPMVCGGIHATVAPEQVLGSGLFDYVLAGECDTAFLELVDTIAKGGDPSGIRNLGFLKDGAVHLNPVRPFPDLASLPMKDYTIFDFQKLIDEKNGWVGLMASRGCPFQCTYCFNHIIVKKYRADLDCGFSKLNYIRHFPVSAMIAEIRYLLEHYTGINMFIFDDDLFTFDADYLAEFCAEYRKICRIPFVVNAHVHFFDPRRARSLADAGCRIVKFGLESGSPRVRKEIMRRHTSNKDIAAAIQYAKDEGMHTSCFVMIGLPGETAENVMETIRLLAEAKPGRFRWTFFYPYPGTEAYAISERGGYIDFDKKESLVNFTDATCLDFGPEQNLFLQKVGRVMPWFVNAWSDLDCADVYRQKVDELLALDETSWKAVGDTLTAEDKRLSQEMVQSGKTHYAIKYNRFMGVISDYFLGEEKQPRP
ncbi:MAG: radical SAM protein [Thermodesulfobacteriota bacterium]